MTDISLEQAISEQTKLLTWHLRNLNLKPLGSSSPGIKRFQPLAFSPSLIDHTLLRPDATPHDIEGVCQEALKYTFASVCVAPSYVSLASEVLKGSSVKPITVVGFPLGYTTPLIKVDEAKQAVDLGALELDMVIHIGLLKAKAFDQVFTDIQGVVQAAGSVPVKVIVESCLLNPIELIQACLLSVFAGASFVKTSTGFSKEGATSDAVQLMRRVVGPSLGVKASGGIKSLKDAQQMLEAGASRLGTSSGVRLVQEQLSPGDHHASGELY